MLIVFNDVPLMFSCHGVYVVLKTSSGLSLMFSFLRLVSRVSAIFSAVWNLISYTGVWDILVSVGLLCGP